MNGREVSEGVGRRGATARVTSGTVAAVIGLALVLASCVGAPQVQHYRLAPEAMPSASGVGGAHLRIGIVAFRVDPPYDQDRIVYRLAAEPQRIGFYSYHRWAAPLERMVPLAAARLLEGRPGIALAEPADPDRHYDALLGGRVLAAEEIDRAGSEEGRAEVELWLSGPDGDELWRGRFEGRAEADVETVAQVVALVEQALAEALGRGLDEALRHLGPSGVDSAAPPTDPDTDPDADPDTDP